MTLAAGQAPARLARARPICRRIVGTRLSGALLLVVLLALWEGSARSGLVRSDNWPPFTAVLASMVQGLTGGEVLPALASTLWRLLRGYVVGSAAGVALGFAIALSRPVRQLLLPTIELIRPVPIPAIIPPLIFLLGLDDRLRIFAIAVATFFPVVLNTIAGVRGVEPVYRQVARTFGVPPAAAIRRVVFPAALPFILAGLRTSLGLAFVVTVIAEMIVGQDGIGYYLLSMQFAMRAPDMYAGIILVTLVAYAMNRAFLAWEARVIRWARLAELARGDAP